MRLPPSRWQTPEGLLIADGGGGDDGDGDPSDDDSWEEPDGSGDDSGSGDSGGGSGGSSPDRSDRPATNALMVDGELIEIDHKQGRGPVVVNETEIPGAYEVTFSGEGYESQYLNEIETGGSDGANQYWEDSEANPNSGSGGSGSDGGEEPPLHIEIEAYVAQDTAEALVALRDQNDQFPVVVAGTTYRNMELHDFTRTLSGESPYAYEASIEVVEWREIEVDTSGTNYGNPEDQNTGGGSANSDPAEDAEELESGSPDDPRVMSMDAGEQRNFRISGGNEANNVLFDTSAPDSGAMVYPRGDGWVARDMGWRGEENRSGIAAQGSGKLANIYLGHQGDSGVIVEDAQRVAASQLNVQHSENGVHIVEGSVGDLAKGSSTSGSTGSGGGGTGGGGGGGGDGGGSGGSGGGSDPPQSDFQTSLDSPSVFDDTYRADTISSSSTSYGDDAGLQTVIEGGSHEGGYGQISTSRMFGRQVDELHQRFYIYFGSNTNPNDNCKMPGFNGDYNRTLSGTTQPNGANGWSARGVYRSASSSSVELGFYVYHADQPNWWGKHVWSGATLSHGTWYQIDQYIQLNTPGVNDGILRLWVDGNQVYSSSDWRWRDTANLQIESFWHDFYHGGDNTAPNTYSVYTDEYSAWASKGPQL